MLLLALIFFAPSQGNQIEHGDISFVSIDAENDQFEVLTVIELQPGTSIHFTDSEWNGNHFGFDESNLIWNTGEQPIPEGTLIQFNKLAEQPYVTYGTLSNTMSLSKKGDAIFAYQGTTRMPTRILASVANDSLAYGTLVNTGLIPGITALTFTEKPQQTLYEEAPSIASAEQPIKGN